MAGIITIILIIALTCLNSCASVSYIKKGSVDFPPLNEEERIDDGLNITVIDKDGQTVFYYDGKADTVTIPRWYWIKIMNYAIDTGGVEVSDK